MLAAKGETQDGASRTSRPADPRAVELLPGQKARLNCRFWHYANLRGVFVPGRLKPEPRIWAAGIFDLR